MASWKEFLESRVGFGAVHHFGNSVIGARCSTSPSEFLYRRDVVRVKRDDASEAYVTSGA